MQAQKIERQSLVQTWMSSFEGLMQPLPKAKVSITDRKLNDLKISHSVKADLKG